ncbi:MAG: DUF2298 domain-containing protein [Chloroflexi bacterium]|nr:DUF2298 domain-containing protein [Chloroflexota bacterium]
MIILLDWLSREGHLLLAWWLWITLAGLAALPFCFRVFGALPDRGYTTARILGLLFVTWVFWLLASCGFLDNSPGSIMLSWLLVLSASLALYGRGGEVASLVNWWRDNRSLVVLTELLFAILFFGWALYRAHQNGLAGTEKPMELAFLSAAQRSASFPPNDPWMSGYAVSYYYMGYIMSAALSSLSGISSTIGFNLTNASMFSLTGMAAFGVAYNLVRSRAVGIAPSMPRNLLSRVGAFATGLLAMLMLVLMGNFQFALIEAPLQTRAMPRSYLEFWRTQKLADLESINYEQVTDASLISDTSRWRHWWWFNASRVPTDFDLDGRLTGIQPIGEFPAFSFLLADNHPHVLALPFVVSAIALMLAIVLDPRPPTALSTIVYGFAVGGLAFLNAWDAPTFLAGLAGAEALRRLITGEPGKLSRTDWLETAKFGGKLTLIAAIAYLPYWVGLRSQAGGILPNLLHPSLFRHFFIMFGPLLVILLLYLAVESWRGHRLSRINWRLGLSLGFGLLATMLLLMTVLGALLAISNPGGSIVGNLYSPDSDFGNLIRKLAQRRIEYGLTAILLVLGISAVAARLFPARKHADRLGEVAITWIKYPPATGFALLLIGMGLCLALFCEFFYLKDNFFVRINTVFKLYFQAWALWSIASAYAVYSLLNDRSLAKPHGFIRLALAALVALAILAGISYTIVGIKHRALVETGREYATEHRRFAPPASWTGAIRHVHNGEVIAPGTVLYSRVKLVDAQESDLLRADIAGIAIFDGNGTIISEPLTLDGARGLLSHDDQQVINCLRDAVDRRSAVVAEAVGEAYNIAFGRVGALTGIPIILGWENHERQWRGATYPDIVGSRAADIRDLYTRYELDYILPIIDRYQITHLMYGSTERRIYGSEGEEKFLDHFPVQCESGSSRIFYAGN